MMVVLISVVAVALYVWAYRHAQSRGRMMRRSAPYFFIGGVTIITAALSAPVDARADASLAWHMVQHLILIMAGAPLLLLGAPVRLLLAILPPQAARAAARILTAAPVRAAAHPLFGLALLAGVLYAAHFSPLYQGALEHPTLHAFEHGLFLAAGLGFWSPILAVAPNPHAPSHPLRILTLLLSLPVSAFLGFAFYVSGRVLYPHYAARPGALADQMNAGAVMWLSAGTPVLLALLWCVADWGAHERRLGAIFDAAQSD